MKQSVCLCWILLSAGLLSCNKNKDGSSQDHATMTFAKAAFDYVKLPLNRYFIYKDSATGIQDSVVVTRSDLYMSLHPGRQTTGLFDFGYNEYYYQVYKLELTKIAGKTRWFYGEAEANFLTSFPANDSLAPFIFCGTDNLLPPSPVPNLTCYYGFTYPAYGRTSYQPAMTVEGRTYNDVFNVFSSNGVESDSTQTWYITSTYYWARNIGIIKRIVNTNTAKTTSSLVRFGN